MYKYSKFIHIYKYTYSKCIYIDVYICVCVSVCVSLCA